MTKKPNLKLVSTNTTLPEDFSFEIEEKPRRTPSNNVRVRRRLREEAASLKSSAILIVLVGLIGACSMSALYGFALNLWGQAVAFAVCFVGAGVGLTSIVVAVILFSVAETLLKEARHLKGGVAR